MTQLASRLAGGGVGRLVFLSSSPYDERSQGSTQRLTGVNSALALTADLLRGLAAETGNVFVDLHGPMTRCIESPPASAASYPLIGGDRVHPTDTGAMMMAYLILKAQSAPALVSEVSIDAKRSKAACANCSISGLTRRKTHVAFEMLGHALPWPVDESAAGARHFVPLEQDLNREVLAVRNLKRGTYRLTIDRSFAGEFSSSELAGGVNLAVNPATPQFRQAQKLAALSEERRRLESSVRDIVKIEIDVLGRAGIPLADEAAVQSYLTTYVEALKSKDDQYRYYKSTVEKYYRMKPKLPEMRCRIDELKREILEVAKPLPHRYELERRRPVAAP